MVAALHQKLSKFFRTILGIAYLDIGKLIQGNLIDAAIKPHQLGMSKINGLMQAINLSPSK
ncbi:hypothetical protein D3C85_1822550 [compost metagenome]